MKLNEFFKKAIEVGIANDPRGEAAVREELDRVNSEYTGLSDREKQWFNTERLWNPFTDSRLHFGDPELEISKIAVAIDVDNSELLLVNELNKRGAEINALVSHHPGGFNNSFHHVMEVQVDMMAAWGVPINKAEALMGPRMAEVARSILPGNVRRFPRTAELLGIPYMSLHSAADVCVQKHVQDTVDKANPRTLGDLIELLTDSYPEYYEARKMQEAMTLFVGNKKNRAGKVVVKFCGGTQGPSEAFAELAAAGVGTMVCMHLRDDAKKEAEKHSINILVAGHMASDSIGLNLLFAGVDPQKQVEVLPLSGYIYKDRR